MSTQNLRPIRTAPKDGKVHTLVWAPNNRIEHQERAFWDQRAREWRPVEGTGFCTEMTHWYPNN